MDRETGHIYEGTAAEIKEVEKKLGYDLVPIDQKSLEEEGVKLMVPSDRIAFVKRVQKRRAKNKARRKVRRRQRKK